MKKRSSRLRKIVSLAEAEERNLRAMTGHSQKLLNEQQQKLGELNAYRHSYANKTRGDTQLNSAHMKDYQNFLSRLDQAMRSQQQVVIECEKAVELHRRRWMVKRQRLESLQQVHERYCKQESLQADRLEQRVLDDLPMAPPLYDDKQ